MPRASLDSDKPAGESRWLKVRISNQAEQAAKSALAEGESLSAMVREAIKREIQRRKRAKQ